MTLTAEPTVTTQRQLALVVTHEHIAKGQRQEESRCAVALAFRDAGYPGVLVGWGRIHSSTASIRVPEEMRLWIAQFDYGSSKVHPERFVLDLPADWPEPEFPGAGRVGPT